MHLVFEFDYDGGGSHKGATGSIIVNGKKVGTGRIEKTVGHCTHWPPKPQTSAPTATYPPSKSHEKPTVSFLGVRGSAALSYVDVSQRDARAAAAGRHRLV